MIESEVLRYYETMWHHAISLNAIKDIKALFKEIESQRATANQLAEQSQRLRATAEHYRKALDLVKEYAEACHGQIYHPAAQQALGTLVNMVTQCFDSETGS